MNAITDEAFGISKASSLAAGQAPLPFRKQPLQGGGEGAPQEGLKSSFAGLLPPCIAFFHS